LHDDAITESVIGLVKIEVRRSGHTRASRLTARSLYDLPFTVSVTEGLSTVILRRHAEPAMTCAAEVIFARFPGPVS